MKLDLASAVRWNDTATVSYHAALRSAGTPHQGHVGQFRWVVQ